LQVVVSIIWMRAARLLRVRMDVDRNQFIDVHVMLLGNFLAPP
jgi:hypothetical protein